MLNRIRVPSSLLKGSLSSRALAPRPLCVRFASRWNPSLPAPRRKPRRRIPTEEPADPKDLIPGWPELKAKIIAKCTTREEIEVIDELSPEEVQFLLNEGEGNENIEVPRASRMVPANPNYFSGQPIVEQRLQDVEQVYEKYKHLPKAPPHIWPVREWKNAGNPKPTDNYDVEGGVQQQPMKGRIKRTMVALGKELNKIHPVLMPPELKAWLDDFAPLRQAGAGGLRQKRTLDKYSRSKGNGKRKTARAKVQVVPGEGQIYVNGKLAAEYFTRLKDVENVIWPLQSLCAVGQYNVWVSTWGGGTTGTLAWDSI
jgi:small subunit ribosomal protein S9